MQNSGPWDPWLPVVENSRLFAQRTVRPLVLYTNGDMRIGCCQITEIFCSLLAPSLNMIS